jgi:hypothetical protein
MYISSAGGQDINIKIPVYITALGQPKMQFPA